MQVLVKMLNDALSDTAEALDDLICAEDMDIHIEENMARIDAALDGASNILAVVPKDIRGKKTWEYDRGGECAPEGEGFE